MKKLLLFSFIIIFQFNTSAQKLDLIVSNKGDSIACKIDSVTASHIYFEMTANGGDIVNTMFDLNNIKVYKKDIILKYQYLYKSGTSIIAGKKVNHRYKDYKNIDLKYTYPANVANQYDPSLAGLMAVVPGLGHVYVGEPVRGLVFLGGMTLSLFPMGIGFGMAWGGQAGAGLVFLTGVAGFFTIYVCNFIDAVKVAKVKNIVNQNKNISFKIEPFIEKGDYQFQANNIGFSVKINF